MKHIMYVLVCAVCVQQTSAKLIARGIVTEACMKTLETWVNVSGSSAPSNDAGWCTLFEATVDGVSAYQCVVRIGLCTDEEFVALKNGACDQKATAQQTSSALKTSVYNLVNSTSSECQARLVDCIFRSSLATVLKQQEQYCKMMNLEITNKTTTTCLTPDCTSTDISNLNTTSCSTTQSQPFSDSIVAVSQKCQDGMESCTYDVTQALALIKGEQFCDVMSLSVKTTTHACLISKGCTETEFQKVKAAACSGSNIVEFTTKGWNVSEFTTQRTTVSTDCNKSLDTYISQSGNSACTGVASIIIIALAAMFSIN